MQMQAQRAPRKPCPRALKDAREMARRLGSHQPEDCQAAVLLVGSKATGTHGPASDTDLIVIPATESWAGEYADRCHDRAVSRFQRGARTNVLYHPNGTDLTVMESWETHAGDDTTLCHQDQGTPWPCWSSAEEENIKFYDGEPDPHHVPLTEMPWEFPEPDLERVDAVITADNLEILQDALGNITGYPTAALDCRGTPVHIVPSSCMARKPAGGYGRWDFPHHGPKKDKSVPHGSIYDVKDPRPETLMDLVQEAAAAAEDAAEALGEFHEHGVVLEMLNQAALTADAAAEQLHSEEST